jgi:hypothetical protein
MFFLMFQQVRGEITPVLKEIGNMLMRLPENRSCHTFQGQPEILGTAIIFRAIGTIARAVTDFVAYYFMRGWLLLDGEMVGAGFLLPTPQHSTVAT